MKNHSAVDKKREKSAVSCTDQGKNEQWVKTYGHLK